MRAAILVLAAAAFAAPLSAAPSYAQGADADSAERYEQCMRLAERRPDDGFESALAWRDMGGGAAAEHCAATALIGLGLYDEAGRRLEEVGNDTRLEPALRGRLLGQAGQAWLLAGQPARAEAALTAAMQLLPNEVELKIDRSQARAALGDYENAVADLDAAAARAPDRADIFAFRAAAHRFLEHGDQARADVMRALNLQPNHQEALLELGNLKRLAGENDHAREAWLRVVTIDPDSAAANAARENIERMDVEGRTQDPPPQPK